MNGLRPRVCMVALPPIGQNYNTMDDYYRLTTAGWYELDCRHRYRCRTNRKAIQTVYSTTGRYERQKYFTVQ